jgi:KDO2-lipid IV(A) lauroyltransferase
VFSRVVEWLLFALLGSIRCLPLVTVARLGRLLGGLACRLDRRHRRVAEDNIAKTFPELRPKEIQSLALENFRRIGEAYACAIRTPGMDSKELLARIEFVGLDDLLQSGAERLVVATGHFGGFDLLAHVQGHWPDRHLATTYRAQRFTPLNTALQRLRALTGVEFIERHNAVQAVSELFNKNKSILALFSDQHGGGKGLWLPFLGRDCSCSPAPAVIALRYKALLTMAICYRTNLARWRIEVGPVIPTHDEHGQERSLEDITLEIHRQFDIAVRRDPANWFWVHRRWKPPTANQRPHDQASGPTS